MNDSLNLLSTVTTIAIEAGKAVMSIYSREFDSYEKEDKSPLTEADLAAHHCIVRSFDALTKNIPVLSEESRQLPYETRRRWSSFWLVDPLDGTKEFIKRNGEFTVNIALIEDGHPVLGVVHAPAIDTTYTAAKGCGAWVEREGFKSMARVRPYTGGVLDVVASRSHAGPDTEALIDRLRAKVGEVELLSIGSSLKICLVAEGKAHLYPRLGLTSEWDVAAAHAVVEEAGGSFTDVDGNPFQYNKENLLNPYFLVSAPGVPL